MVWFDLPQWSTAPDLAGFAIVDGFLGEELCDALRKEIRTGEEERLLHPNATHLVTAGKYGSARAHVFP